MTRDEFLLQYEISEWLLKEALGIPLVECTATTVEEAEAICESIIKTYKKDKQEENFEYEENEEYRAAFIKWLDLCSTPREVQTAYLSVELGGEPYERIAFEKWDEISLKVVEEANDFKTMTEIFYSGIPLDGKSGRLLIKRMYEHLT